MNPLHDPSSRGFNSDNCAGAHPEVLAAVAAANGGHQPSYGEDVYTARLREVFRRHFGERTEAYPVFNGTGANVVGLKAMTEPWSGVICAESSHLNLDEGGAWKAIAPMPTARMGAATIVYGNNVFVCGGKTASGAATNAVESFDLVSGTWTRRDPLPEAVEGAVGSKLGERMVITGGRVNGHATKHTWGSPFPFGN